MLTGKPPFTGDDVTSIMFQILNFVPPPPSAVNPAIPSVLDFIVAKALAKAADDRYASAAELARDLHDCAQQAHAAGPAPSTVNTLPQAMLDSNAHALVRSLPGDRRADSESVLASSAPALGLSKAFDSLEATVKLAIRTGMMEAVKDLPGARGSATEARAMVGEMRAGPGWNALDKTIFGISVLGAVIIGAIIIFA